jgi:hypothetical protein
LIFTFLVKQCAGRKVGEWYSPGQYWPRRTTNFFVDPFFLCGRLVLRVHVIPRRNYKNGKKSWALIFFEKDFEGDAVYENRGEPGYLLGQCLPAPHHFSALLSVVSDSAGTALP